VLPQNNAVNKVGDRTREFLRAGRISDASHNIRLYLEYRLQDLISKCRIPVPIDLAFNDNNQLASEYLKAITAAVDLNHKAGILILDAAQQFALNANMVTITGNYLSHWATGSTQNFTGGALLGVMDAIDEYIKSFQYEEPPAGSGRFRFYKSLSQR
jgi:hypothetical protein